MSVELNIIYIFIFVLGSMIGSFLNVLIYRLPLEQDFIFKRSFCPHCKQGIPFYLNIPIVGFLFLRGKCQNCKKRISWRYPLVELLVGSFFLFAFPEKLEYFTLISYLVAVFIFSALIVHFFIDIDHFLLLDKVNIFLLVVIFGHVYLTSSWVSAFWGGGVGYLFPFGISWAFYLLRGKVGLGGGDIKLFGILGLHLGITGILQNIFWSSLLGSVVGAILIVGNQSERERPLAFGPYIIIIYLLQIYFPQLFTYIPIFNF